MSKTPRRKSKKKRGRRPGGVRDFVRRLLRRNPKLETPNLRERAKAEFGHTLEIHRHFPQLVYEIRKQLRIKIKRAG